MPSVCKGQKGEYVPLQAQDALPSSMVCVSFSPQVAHPQCKGPSRIAPVSFSLSHSVWSSHVLGAGTLPGNSSAEQFPAAHMSPHMDPPDTSSSLRNRVGKSHVHSTSPVPPAPHTSCSHARWLHFCTTACLGPGGLTGPLTQGHHQVWSRGNPSEPGLPPSCTCLGAGRCQARSWHTSPMP